MSLSTYYIVNKFFPEKKEVNVISEEDKFRGGADGIIKKTFDSTLNERSFKLALIVLFTTESLMFFQEEIIELLASKNFIKKCLDNDKLKDDFICKLISEHELNLHTEHINKIILSDSLNEQHKLKLLRIKLDWILNSESGGKREFALRAILSIIIGTCATGSGGLFIILDTLYRLFKTGKLSEGMYIYLRKLALSKIGVDNIEL